MLYRGYGQRAFTLSEMLITLAITGILIGMTFPGMESLHSRQQSKASSQLLFSALVLARNTAISHGHLVTVCRSADGLVCGGNWSQGVIVFTDTNGNRKIDNSDSLVSRVSTSGFRGRIYWRSFGNRQYVQFLPTGATRGQNGNFTLCPDSGFGEAAQQIVISRTGRIRYAVDSDGDGLVEDSRGKPVRC